MRKYRGALVLASICCLPLNALGAPLPAAADDLRESYQLLSNTYYAKVDQQKMLDAAHAALQDIARRRGVRVALPPLRDTGKVQANVEAVAAEIGRVENAASEARVDVTYAAIDAMTRALGDRYTAFFTPDAYRQFNAVLDPEKISGIGVLIDPDANSKMIRVYYVVPGTPAERAGLQSGDVLASIDGTSTRNITRDDASKLLRGKAGTAVSVRVVRDGKPLAPIQIVRSEVQPPSVIFRMLPHHVAYIWIMQFGRETPSEFSTALERAARSDVRAYVVDLRNDGGGYVQSALEISAKFINRDPLLTIEQRNDRSVTVQADGRAMPRRPTVLLVNENTASASEITAGALQDDGIASLVGKKTFGKGVMQSLTELPDGAAIKITTAHYLTPKNRDINLKGIQPDYVVSENADARFGEIDHDAQLQAALSILDKKLADLRP